MFQSLANTSEQNPQSLPVLAQKFTDVLPVGSLFIMKTECTTDILCDEDQGLMKGI